jgi:hypothetical protein
MPSLVALIVVLVATAASALPAESHGWYAGLRSPSGMPCCNERDCRPVASRVNHDTGREEILANGAWYAVEYGKVLPFSSPDGGYHACWGNAAGRPNFRCIILPGMASLAPSEGSARITSGFPVQPDKGPGAHFTQTVEQDGRFNGFLRLLEAAGMVELLEDEGAADNADMHSAQAGI